jgi:hypothetical protein
MTENKTLRERLIDLLEEYGREEYARGRKDALLEFSNIFKGLADKPQAEYVTVPFIDAPVVRHRSRLIAKETPEEIEEEDEADDGLVRAGSDEALVLDLIRKDPGLAGHQIVSILERRVNERTVRTALYRLRRNKNLIENREGKWFPVKE